MIPQPWDDRLARIVAGSGIPGAAVAVVHGDRHWVRGFGVTRFGGDTPVGPRTAFDLGSCSKSYVATAVAMLVSDGALGFDDPVQKHLPEMLFDQDSVTRSATVRDLLCNRIGLKRQIPVESFANPDIAALEVIQRVRHLDRLHPFREGYVYFNPGFMAGRLIVERVSGLPYGEFLERRLFGRLGMSNSASGSDRVAHLAERAQGHVMSGGAPRPIEDLHFDNWQGAAGVYSCAEDAVPWLRFQLNAGRAGDAQLLDAAVLAETHRPHTVMPKPECKLIHCPPEAPLTEYGMGWWMTSLHGRRVVQHAGEMFAFRAQTALIPEERIGVCVMLSLAAPRHAAMAYTVLETLLTGVSRDWCEVADRLAAEQNADVRRLLDSAFPVGTEVPLPLERYTGSYVHPACGEAQVHLANGALELSLKDGRIWDLHLEPLGGHVFESRFTRLAASAYMPVPQRVRFVVEGGRVVGLSDPNASYRRSEDP